MDFNRQQSFRKMMCIFLSMAFILTWFPLSLSRQAVVVQAKSGYFREVRKIRTDVFGIDHPAGLVYSLKDRDFRVIPKPTGSKPGEALEMTLVNEDGERKSSRKIRIPYADPINITYHELMGKILFVEPGGLQIAVLPGDSQEKVESLIDIREWKLRNPKGITTDTRNGTVYVIDQVGPRLLKIVPGPEGFTDATITETLLSSLGKAKIQGIAMDSRTGHLHAYSPDGKILYEMDDSGTVIGTRDLSSLGLRDAQAMVFAPSYDTTDPESRMSLFIADSGMRTADATSGGIYELSIVAPASVEEPNFISVLINTIQTSQFSPPSPDSAAVEYIPTLNRLMIADSEVNEMPIYAGANLFETTLGGELQRTGNTLKFSQEPTGLAFNPVTGNMFISDDDMRTIFEVAPGPDGLFGTSDDTTTSFRTRYFGSNDPEGLAFDPVTGTLFMVDGVNAEVYKMKPGANGKFDGIPPYGDDTLTQFDTESLGIIDPEGIGFDARTGNLYITGWPVRYMAEVKPTGELVQIIDIYATRCKVPAGIGVGPSSRDASKTVVYLADRGVDNDKNPLENDGRVYELSLPERVVENAAPLVTITSPADNSTSVSGSLVTFSGSALDKEDGNLTSSIQWNSSLDGNIGTGASFTKSSLTVGTHVVTAAVTDSKGLTGTASVSVTVTLPQNTAPVVTVTSPAANSKSVSGSLVTFSGSAIDTEDGNLTPSIEWISSLDGNIGTGGSFTKDNLTVGTHVITASVTDSGLLKGTASVTITVTAQNTAPMVTITDPTANSKSVSGNPVTFSGSATDKEEGNLTPSIEWVSSLEGNIGKGGSFTKDHLTVGTHVITASVTDSGVLKGSASVTITVTAQNTAPVVTITNPTANSTSVFGDPVSFSGSATDKEDGNLTPSIEWVSSRDGKIGTGNSFTKNSLTIGTHVITASVTDSEGLKSAASVSLTVMANTAPVVTIISPTQDAVFYSNQEVNFTGSALDAEEGDRSEGMLWTSSLDGKIGEGGSFTISNLSTGLHTITVTGADSRGLAGSATVTIMVVENTNPVVNILQPTDGSSFLITQKVTFEGIAWDAEESNLTDSLRWTSSINGLIGTGGSFTKPNLSVGTHVITATVTDAGGLVTSSSVTIVISKKK